MVSLDVIKPVISPKLNCHRLNISLPCELSVNILGSTCGSVVTEHESLAYLGNLLKGYLMVCFWNLHHLICRAISPSCWRN